MHRLSMLVVAFMLACLNRAVAQEYKAVAAGVRYAPIGQYDVAQLEKILTTELADFETAPTGIEFPTPRNGVRLYRVIYPTVIPEKNNQPTEASGLVAVPDVPAEGQTFPLVSWQHGTVFTKTAVPSFPEESMETRLVVAHLGGNGYVVIGADYIGKGLSSAPDSYMVRESTIQACADMLAAAKLVLADLGISTDSLFLSGWSQGAYSTQVFRRRLEEQGVPVMAAATAATPSSPMMLAIRWINKRTPFDVQWVLGTWSLLLNSYEYYYDLPGLAYTAIRTNYLQQALDLYANKVGWEDVESSWPQTPPEFLNADFAAQSALVGNRFYRLMQENEAYQWRSKTPARYYYGAADEVIAPYIATLPVGYQETLGGAEATAVFAGEQANHRGAFIFGVHDQKNWFDGFRRP